MKLVMIFSFTALMILSFCQSGSKDGKNPSTALSKEGNQTVTTQEQLSTATTMQQDAAKAANNIESPGDSVVKDEKKATYKRYSAFIEDHGDHIIIMNVHNRNNWLSGYAYIPTRTINYGLSGAILSDNSFEMTFSDANDPEINEIAAFSGKYTGDTELKGVWEDKQNKSKIDVAFQEKYDDGAVPFKCEMYEDKKTIKKKDGDSEINVSFFSLQIDDSNSIYKPINEQLITLAKGKNKSASFKSIADKIMEENVKEVTELEFTTFYTDEFAQQVVYNDNNILVISVTNYGAHGGAHGNYVTDYYTFDLTTGKRLLLSDILKSGYKDKLKGLAEKAMRNKMHLSDKDSFEEVGFDMKTFKLPEDLDHSFFIQTGSMVIKYKTYEIGPYVIGEPAIEINLNDLMGILKTDGPLKEILADLTVG